MTHRRLARGPMLHGELRAAHAAGVVRIRAVDAELQSLLARRRSCLDELESIRRRVDLRYSRRHGRRRPMVDEPPMPPELPDARPLHGVELRAVAVRLLRQHGRHRLRDLHGLLHCYGYAVAGPRPVKDLADAMGYEVRCGRVRRVERGVYEAEPLGDEVPYPRWLGPRPEPADPLPWSEPVSAPGPPLIDPVLAEDPVLWSGGGHREPVGEPSDRAAPDDAVPGERATLEHPIAHPLTPDDVGSDSVPNRTPRRRDRPDARRSRPAAGSEGGPGGTGAAPGTGPPAAPGAPDRPP